MPRKYAEIEQALFAAVGAELRERNDPESDRIYAQMDRSCVSELDVLQAWLRERPGTRCMLEVAPSSVGEVGPPVPEVRAVILGQARDPKATDSPAVSPLIQPTAMLATALRCVCELHEKQEAGTSGVLLQLKGKPAT